MALDNSKKIKSSEKSVETQKENFSEAQTGYKYTPVTEGLRSADKPAFLSYFNNAYMLELYKKQLENEKKQLVIDAKTAYFNCLNFGLRKIIQEKTVAMNELKLSQEKSRYAVGMATKSSVGAAESLVATDKAALEDAVAKLDKAYNTLSTMLGLDQQNTIPVLTSPVEAEFAKLDDVDLETKRAVDNSMEVWTGQESARLSTQLRIFERDPEVGQYKEEKAYLDAAVTKDNVKLQLRDLCNSINYVVEKNNQLVAQKEEAEENYRVVKAQYDLGMITKDILLRVELLKLGIDSGLSELSAQYVINRDALAKYQNMFTY